jgi:hypothetical protein
MRFCRDGREGEQLLQLHYTVLLLFRHTGYRVKLQLGECSVSHYLKFRAINEILSSIVLGKRCNVVLSQNG